MIRPVLLLAILISLFACPAHAAHAVLQIADTDDAGDCAVAMVPGGMVAVAWCQDGDIYTVAFEGCYSFGPDNHGPGSMPELCWMPDGFMLTYVTNTSIQIRSCDYWMTDEWTDVANLASNGEPIVNLALTGWQPAAEITEAYLCWETQDGIIWFSRGGLSGWLPGEPVLQHDNYEFAHPRAQPILSGSAVWPRIYYLNWDSLLTLDGVGYSWGAPVAVPGFIGSDFEAAAGPGYSQHLLALGPQPTCPCNFIQYTEQPSGGAWLPSEEITVHIDDYDWPMYPRLGVDADGRAHAFWYQQAADGMMNPTLETMHYFVREEGAWLDESDELDDHFGIQGDLAMDGWGGASMVWNESGALGREIWLATTTMIGMAALTPTAFFDLGTYPNPFNPRTEIQLQLPEAAALSLKIHDLSGRCLRTLADGEVFPAGAVGLDWDGRDDAGRQLASGVYLVRLTTMGETRSLRAVLLK
jgi:hypothetical protein